MKQNRPYENTYSNRVLQFAMDEEARREREKKSTLPSPNVTAKQPVTPPNGDNDFIHAYTVVFGKLTPDQQAEIKRLEEAKNVDNATYNQFICNVIKEAGEVPSHDLQRASEKCNCFSCQRRK